MIRHTGNYVIATCKLLRMTHAYGILNCGGNMYTTTTHTETRINVVEYIILNYDFDMSKHNTEYTYSINIDEGGTSVDVIELPSYTPNICYHYPSIDAPSNGNGRETDTCSACNKRKGTRVERLNSPWFFFFSPSIPVSI